MWLQDREPEKAEEQKSLGTIKGRGKIIIEHNPKKLDDKKAPERKRKEETPIETQRLF
jgi:hypothetical protein